jgi:hypothetical protein
LKELLDLLEPAGEDRQQLLRVLERAGERRGATPATAASATGSATLTRSRGPSSSRTQLSGHGSLSGGATTPATKAAERSKPAGRKLLEPVGGSLRKFPRLLERIHDEHRAAERQNAVAGLRWRLRPARSASA